MGGPRGVLTPAPQHDVPDEPGWSARTWTLLVVLGGALFIDGLDATMVGVALPSVGSEFGMAPSTLQWFVSAYVLGYGGLLLLGGRTADLLGRRTVFLTAIAVFGAVSMVSALLSDGTMIIALRFVKGVASAFAVPAGLSIITTTFAEGPARSRALSIYAICGASALSSGLLLGGLLTQVSWRIAFGLTGPVAILLLAVGAKVIPHTARAHVSLRHFDLVGAFAITGSLLAFVYAVIEAPLRGWTSVTTVVLLVASVALAVLFVRVENRHPHPLIRLGFLRSAQVVHANIAGAVMFGGYASFQFVISLYLQGSLGWSSTAMGLTLLPIGLLFVASAFTIRRVLNRVDTRWTIALGLAAFTAGYAAFLQAKPDVSHSSSLLPTAILLGLGFGLCFPSINAQATAGIDTHEQGLASGMVNMSIQVGGALMLAVTTAIIGAAGSSGRSEPLPNLSGAIAAICVLTAAGLVGTLTLLLVSRGTTRSRTRPYLCSVRPPPRGEQQVRTSQLTYLGARMPNINNIAVVGAGTLGTQIAYHSALYGFPAVVHDITEEALLAARTRMEELGDHYREADVAVDRLDAALGRVQFTTDLKLAVAEADLVIEAVPEVPDLKRHVYRKLAQITPPKTIVTTNSSTLLPSQFAEYIGRPDRFLATHYSNQLWSARIVEIMGSPHTDPTVVEAVVAFVEATDLVPIRLRKEQPGYVLNSLLIPQLVAAGKLWVNGVADPATIDLAWRINGPAPLGPFQVLDMIGLMTAYNVSVISADPEARAFAAALKEQYIDKGKLGVSTGEGFYTY
ncbi:3-hydroxyacyl-CoA dehydrogenase [Streptomyces chartreusis]